MSLIGQLTRGYKWSTFVKEGVRPRGVLESPEKTQDLDLYLDCAKDRKGLDNVLVVLRHCQRVGQGKSKLAKEAFDKFFTVDKKGETVLKEVKKKKGDK